MCICVCINRNDKSRRNLVFPFGYNNKYAMFVLYLKKLYGLIINSNVKCVFCTKKHVWVYWAHCESFLNQLQINGTYSYLVKITIEKIDICEIPLLNSQKKLWHIERVSVNYPKPNSLNPNLNEISMLIEYSNQVSSYSWSVVISNIWSPFQTILFWKICPECN